MSCMLKVSLCLWIVHSSLPLRFSLTFIYILYWNVKFSILFWSNVEVYSIQLDAIKIVSDFRQVMGFIPDNPAFSINKINRYAITDILLTVVLITHTPYTSKSAIDKTYILVTEVLYINPLTNVRNRSYILPL
jgi:hypothetical protein